MTGSRRRFGGWLLVGFLLGIPPVASAAESVEKAKAGQVRVYIGTYTRGASKGVYLSRLDLATGALAAPELAAETTNPSFVAADPSRRFLYAVGEVDRFAGQKGGVVSAFSIDSASGKLTLLNQQSTRGAGPCHVAVDHRGRWALVANYGGGSVACFPIGQDGRLGEATCFIQHKGSSVNPQRQQGPHAHAVYIDEFGKFAPLSPPDYRDPGKYARSVDVPTLVFAPDLGLDKVMIYRLDTFAGLLTPSDPPKSVSMAPGAGPRHMAFHPVRPFAYVINEINSTVTVLVYDNVFGRFMPLESVSTLPEGFEGKSTTAEIQIHPLGQFLYGSNRGHDSIVAFAIDPATGKLRLIGFEPTQGKTPRNFAIDPTGQYLLAANQDSNNVVVFRIDTASGKLQPTGQSIKVGSPVCVAFVLP